MGDYVYGIYKHFDFLVEINYYYYNYGYIGDNLRNLTTSDFILMEQKLTDFFNNIANTNIIEEICELILNLTGFFWLMQPFSDGNTRTLRKFIELLFAVLNYNVNLNTNEFEQPIIPLFYSLDETCKKEDIEKLMLRLTKKEID